MLYQLETGSYGANDRPGKALEIIIAENELQRRSSRFLSVVTLGVALVSLFASAVAIYFSKASWDSSNKWEERQIQYLKHIDKLVQDQTIGL